MEIINDKYYYRGIDMLIYSANPPREVLTDKIKLIDAILDDHLFEYIMDSNFCDIYHIFYRIEKWSNITCYISSEYEYDDYYSSYITIGDLKIKVRFTGSFPKYYKLYLHGKKIKYEPKTDDCYFRRCENCNNICKCNIGQYLANRQVKSARNMPIN